MELSESESVIVLLKDLASKGKLDELVDTLQASFAAFPRIEMYVRGKIPPIMLNNYFFPRSGLDASDLDEWASSNTDWAKLLSDNVTDKAKFSLAVTKIENDIKRI